MRSVVKTHKGLSLKRLWEFVKELFATYLKTLSKSSHPPPGILKEPEPRPLFVLPVRRQPGILLTQEAAFRVRHEDREAAIGGGQSRDPGDRAIGIGGIGFGGLPVV